MKRKNVMFTVVLCAVLVLCSMALFFRAKNGEVSCVLGEPSNYWDSRQPVELTPEEQEQADWLDEFGGAVAITRDTFTLTTFAQASKFCDWVVVGTVEEAKLGTSENNQIVLSVDTYLYGKKTKQKMAFNITYRNYMFTTSIEQRVAKPGDRMLVFLSDKWPAPVFFLDRRPSPTDIAFFYFDRSKVKELEGDGMCVRTHIILDSKEMEDEAIRVAKGYLGFFGENGKRDRDAYVEFLCSLLNSPVKRIRYDAEADLVLFYTREKDPLPDLDKLLADDRVRDEIKDYLRPRLRNEKPKEKQE